MTRNLYPSAADILSFGGCLEHYCNMLPVVGRARNGPNGRRRKSPTIDVKRLYELKPASSGAFSLINPLAGNLYSTRGF